MQLLQIRNRLYNARVTMYYHLFTNNSYVLHFYNLTRKRFIPWSGIRTDLTGVGAMVVSVITSKRQKIQEAKTADTRRVGLKFSK